MKRIAGIILVLALALTAPALMAQNTNTEERGEFGIYADYTRLHHLNNANYWGLGGQLAFNLSRYVQLEGNMAYDFERNFTTTTTTGGTTTFQRTGLRLLSGLFGPKIQTGVGPVKVYGVLKGGFLNFQVNNRPLASGFATQVGTVPGGDTNGVFYPGGGIEFFAGKIGIRAEIGDEMYWDNGVNHNLKFTVGPQIRW